MYFLGINKFDNNEPTVFVVLKRMLKNVKKHYFLEDIIRFSPTTNFEEIQRAIDIFYTDSQFIKNKRVFSQDRRPAKTVRANPTIIAGFVGRDTEIIDGFRKCKIAMEGISHYDEDGWRKEEYGPVLLGNNYFVTGQDMMNCILTVFDQKRLVLDGQISTMPGLREKFLGKNDTTYEQWMSDEFKGVLLALSMVIWFSETVRQIKRY